MKSTNTAILYLCTKMLNEDLFSEITGCERNTQYVKNERKHMFILDDYLIITLWHGICIIGKRGYIIDMIYVMNQQATVLIVKVA